MIALIQAFCSDAHAQSGHRVSSIRLEAGLFDQFFAEVQRSIRENTITTSTTTEAACVVTMQIAGAPVRIVRGRE